MLEPDEYEAVRFYWLPDDMMHSGERFLRLGYSPSEWIATTARPSSRPRR